VPLVAVTGPDAEGHRRRDAYCISIILWSRGKSLYEVACQWELEGIVAKRKDSRYVATRSRGWLKIKNHDCSQAEGRKEVFDRWNGGIPASGSCDLDFES
jgi:ATP-dependent DNA ligase